MHNHLLKEENKLLKARNRKLSMLLVLAMLMTMFVGVGAAGAATYSASAVKSVNTNIDENLGAIILDFPVLSKGYHKGVVKLPADFVAKEYSISAVSKNAIDNMEPAAYKFTLAANFTAGDTLTFPSTAVLTAAAAEDPTDSKVFASGGAIADTVTSLVKAINANKETTGYVAKAAGADFYLTPIPTIDASKTLTLTPTGTADIGNGAGAAHTVSFTAGKTIYNIIALTGNQLQVEIDALNLLTDIKIAVNLTTVFVPSGADAEINASILKLEGDFSDGFVTIAKTSGGAVDIVLSDPGTLAAGNSAELTFTIREDVAGALTPGSETLKLK
jgi:hypothetical protein